MPEQPTSITKSHLAAGRAVDQLRRQLGIVFQENNGACPVEGLTENLLSTLRALPKIRLQLLLTGARARSLGLDTKDARAVCIDAQSMSLATMQALADPTWVSPSQALEVLHTQDDTYTELLHLAKYASLLPAMLLIESDALPEEWIPVAIADVQAYWQAPLLDIVPLAKASLPIEGAEHATLTALRERYGTSVHLALVIGDTHDNPLVRIHSSCVTGDILGSLRCDCGDQLKLALRAIGDAGSGILLYLHQEGRGIGIANKLRAYQLQERGVDTYEANVMLGFAEDERDFAIAAAILKKLNVHKIRMLTNNPHKMAAIEKTGIKVSERVKLVAKSGRHNQAYLEAKGKKAGHLF